MIRLTGNIGGATTVLLLSALVPPSLIYVALPPVLPQIAAHFGGGEKGQEIAQMAQALPFFGLAVGGLVAGWILVRLGQRYAIMFAGFSLLAAGTVGFLGDLATVLLLSCAAIGVVSSLATSALAAMTGTLVEEHRRDRLLGVQVAVSDISTVAAGALAAGLAHQFGWRGPFLIFSTFGVFLIICHAVARPAQMHTSVVAGGLLRVARLTWTVCLGAAFVFFMVATQATQLPFYLEQIGYQTAGSRAVFTTFGLFAAMCGSISFAVMQGRIRPWLIQGFAVISAAMGLWGLALWRGDAAFGIACIFLFGVGIGLTVPTLFAASIRRAPEGLRGHSIGLLNVAIFAGSFVSPFVLSPVAARFGYPGLYAAMALVVAVAGALRVLRLRARPPDGIETNMLASQEI